MSHRAVFILSSGCVVNGSNCGVHFCVVLPILLLFLPSPYGNILFSDTPNCVYVTMTPKFHYKKGELIALHILIFIFLYARQEGLLPVAMKPFAYRNSCSDAPTICHRPQHLPFCISVWPLPMFLSFATLGLGSCFAVNGVDRPVVNYVEGR